MLGFDQHLLSFVVRWIHVVSMAFLLGGTIFLFALAFKLRALSMDEHARLVVGAARRFEFLFWVAIGVQVITGIGNLGAFGQNLPAPTSLWGAKLMLKLFIVVLLLLLSLMRTLLMARLDLERLPANATAPASLAKTLYAGTGLTLAGIVLMAVALAHG